MSPKPKTVKPVRSRAKSIRPKPKKKPLPTKPKPLSKPLVIDYSIVSHEPDSAIAIMNRMAKIAKLMDKGMTLEEAKYMVSNQLA